MGLQHENLESYDSVHGSGKAIIIPDSFTSIGEARTSLDCIRFQYFRESCAAVHERGRVDIAKVVRDWSTALGNFMSSFTNHDKRTLKGAWSLEMNRVLLDMMLVQRDHAKPSTTYDDLYLPYHQQVVALARKIQQSVSGEADRFRHKADPY